MKYLIKLLSVLALIVPTLALATWQIADPTRGVPGAQGLHYSGYPGRYTHVVQAEIFKGSLKGNVERIAAQNGWAVKWDVKKTFSVLVETQLAGPDFVTMMNMLLSHYPVVANYEYNFKHGHKRMTVTIASEQ